MNPNSFMEERKRTSKLLQEERILEFFQVVLTNLEQQVILIQNSLDSSRDDDETRLEKLFKTLDERNDYYSSVMKELLLRSTFLSIDRIHLLMTRESIEAVVERIERVAHRLDLVRLPEWVVQHLMEMTNLLHEQLTILIKWIDPQSQSADIVNQIQHLENQADKQHRSFLKKLYSTTTMTYQQFAQAEILDQLLEDTIDQVEILGRRLHLILEEYKTALQPLPHYLG